MMEEHKKWKKDILLIGYAYSKEKKPKTTAFKRANTVKNFITKNYKINSKSIIVNYKVVDIKKVIVEASFK
jgi:ribosomal protein S18